ncbi:hypothetical protein N3K63_12605 [Microbacterium sp. W1N]|uniref:hypothetical protein n=1 Tax=Microbacterium festucae TaxID=2977531 RepID=UPI0021BE4992|nr:hypothetical protein [Microbacterium festucae]MCT9821119.1 hypothetical protein [Microbacterium festucae]
MARIVSVTAGHQDVRLHQSEVECFVQELRGLDDEKLLHISAFGSTQRQSRPKGSQSMQFDEAMAFALVEQFVAVFGEDVVPRHL